MTSGVVTSPEVCLAILHDWETTRGAWPAVSKRAIADRHGIDKDIVSRIICNADAVRKSAEFHGVINKHTESLASVVAKKETTANCLEKPDGSIVLAIPDLHCPFEHIDALEFLTAVRDKIKPDKVVCLGDEIDAHALSRYPKDPDGLTAGKEIEKAIEHLTGFYLAFPDMMVCESNHTVRPWKLAYQSGLPASFLPSFSKFLNAPDGWVWKNHFIIDGVRYFHGDAGKSGQYAHVNYMKAFKQSVVIGHIHSYAAVNYDGDHFAVNSGCLIDESAYCFAYAKNMPSRPSLGCSIISGGKKAAFLPMLLDCNGRWTGKL